MNIIKDLLNIKQGDVDKLMRTLQDLPGIKETSFEGEDKITVEYDSDLTSKMDIEESIALFYALK